MSGTLIGSQPFLVARGPVAQVVEHVPFKHRVAGSSPARLTSFSIAQESINPMISPFVCSRDDNAVVPEAV